MKLVFLTTTIKTIKKGSRHCLMSLTPSPSILVLVLIVGGGVGRDIFSAGRGIFGAGSVYSRDGI